MRMEEAAKPNESWKTRIWAALVLAVSRIGSHKEKSVLESF
jgi:hypothetical protein